MDEVRDNLLAILQKQAAYYASADMLRPLTLQECEGLYKLAMAYGYAKAKAEEEKAE